MLLYFTEPSTTVSSWLKCSQGISHLRSKCTVSTTLKTTKRRKTTGSCSSSSSKGEKSQSWSIILMLWFWTSKIQLLSLWSRYTASWLKDNWCHQSKSMKHFNNLTLETIRTSQGVVEVETWTSLVKTTTRAKWRRSNPQWEAALMAKAQAHRNHLQSKAHQRSSPISLRSLTTRVSRLQTLTSAQ